MDQWASMSRPSSLEGQQLPMEDCRRVRKNLNVKLMHKLYECLNNCTTPFSSLMSAFYFFLLVIYFPGKYVNVNVNVNRQEYRRKYI